MAMTLIDGSSQLVLVGIAGVAAVWDARTGRIPNWLTLPTLVIAPVAHGALGGWLAAGVAVSGALLCMTAPWVLHRISRGEAIGGGDLKLFGALGALGGPLVGIEIELGSFVVVCVCALTVLAFRGRLFAVLSNALHLAMNPVLPRRLRRTIAPEALTTVRMGPCIALTTIAVVLVERLPSWLQ
jgi:prepilin peptidase CpaA